MRLVETGARGRGVAFAELGVYVVVTVLATMRFERSLLREVVAYVRPRPRPDIGAAASARTASRRS
jgi:hypothetical protein